MIGCEGFSSPGGSSPGWERYAKVIRRSGSSRQAKPLIASVNMLRFRVVRCTAASHSDLRAQREERLGVRMRNCERWCNVRSLKLGNTMQIVVDGGLSGVCDRPIVKHCLLAASPMKAPISVDSDHRVGIHIDLLLRLLGLLCKGFRRVVLSPSLIAKPVESVLDAMSVVQSGGSVPRVVNDIC